MEHNAELKVDGRTLNLTRVDKVMFPETGFTKGHLVDYYIRISRFVLPHLRGRPLTFKRFPDGIHGQFFYEKDAPSYRPKWLKTLKVWRVSGESQITYAVLNDLPSLVWSANLANIELHTFLARAPKLAQPTLLLFDLDPGPPAGILDCAQVALWLRENLRDLGLQSFVKASGSKGLHFCVPLNTPVTYDATQPFAQALAERLEREHPDRIVSEMAKAKRQGKVFIDWSQNAIYKSTVSVYSLRAKREQPFVSMPIPWDDLERALQRRDPKLFDVSPDEAIRRCEAEGDLFAPLLELQQKLPAGGRSSVVGGQSSVVGKGRSGRNPNPNPPSGRARRSVDRRSVMLHDSTLPIKAAKKESGRQKKTTARDGATRQSKTQNPKAKIGALQPYRAKRNFSATREPSGATASAAAASKASNSRLFVIQKHAASHLHYDFRLAMDGVLKSWAVPKGPPYERAEKRLAMQVEDHPMEYARFEGIIPPGNYGAGTVMVWDIGTYELMDGNIHAGKLHLRLQGKKLKGEWILVQARSDDTRRTWFLIKGGESMPRLSPRRDDSSALTRRSMSRIARDGDAEWVSHRAVGR